MKKQKGWVMAIVGAKLFMPIIEKYGNIRWVRRVPPVEVDGSKREKKVHNDSKGDVTTDSKADKGRQATNG